MIALVAFFTSIGVSVFILLPKKDVAFGETGVGLYEGLYPIRENMPEVYRRLAYNLDLFFQRNDKTIKKLSHAHTLAAGALVTQVLSQVALLAGSIF